MYISRAIESVVKRSLEQFPVVLLTGPRQVGKTTLLKESLAETYDYVTLDDFMERQQLANDPQLFFLNHPNPLILDEIQYVPQSFSHLKLLVDARGDNGRFVLTGSQAFDLMENVSESLAGRLAILEMKGLSLRERYGIGFNEAFIPTDDYLAARAQEWIPYKSIWESIHRGDMPRLFSKPEVEWELYYSSYVKTYIERDIRQIVNVENENLFMQFMISIASRSGELLNYHSIAKDIGLSIDTIKRWTSLLEASGVIYLLRPYANNHLKRAIKTPKLYFLDTGLLAYLTRWPTPETLATGAVRGNVFETFVMSEIIKSYLNAGRLNLPLYYYRDKDRREIDLVIEDAGRLYPVEIKLTANPQATMAKNFKVLNKIPDMEVERGTILCLYPEKRWLMNDLMSLPLSAI